MALDFSRLGGNATDFQKMIQRFGVVTVMNVDVYEGPEHLDTWESMDASTIINSLSHPLCHLDTLKIANATQEGPSKTVTGGQYSNPLIKFGKSSRLEMQDALGNARALDALTGTVSEAAAAKDAVDYEQVYAVHVTEDFNGPKTLVGDTFFIDQKSGQQVKAKIIFYQFLPDSIFNLTQDAEGDATVFDMNGDLLTTNILISKIDGTKESHGAFFTIIDPKLCSNGGLFTFDPTDGTFTVATGYDATMDGAPSSSPVPPDSAVELVIKKGTTEVARTILVTKHY